VKPELHPEAAKNFNDKGEGLLAELAPESPKSPSDPLPELFSRPGAPIAARFAEGDYIEFKVTELIDLLDRTIARYFDHEGKRIGLEGERYERLAQLSENIQRTPALRELVSTRWVEDAIIDWMKAKYENVTIPALADYLAEKCEEDAREHELWFPVANLSVESDLTFGNVVFRTITEDIMDRWEQKAQDATQGHGSSYYFSTMRGELQGYAASTIKVTAEPKRAFEVALQESERAVDALRVYHVTAALLPEVTSYCALRGRENVQTVKHLRMAGGRVDKWVEAIHAKPVLNLHLSDDDIRKYSEYFGFDSVNRLLALKNRTSLQERLLEALLLYSRSTLAKDLADRLVYMFTAMESMLLRGPSENIQQNVGERIAFLIADTRAERKKVVENFRHTYALRSKFVHHGHSTISQLETLREFMTNAWELFTHLAKDSDRFSTKEQLMDHLEDMKFS